MINLDSLHCYPSGSKVCLLVCSFSFYSNSSVCFVWFISCNAMKLLEIWKIDWECSTMHTERNRISIPTSAWKITLGIINKEHKDTSRLFYNLSTPSKRKTIDLEEKSNRTPTWNWFILLCCVHLSVVCSRLLAMCRTYDYRLQS